MIKYNLRKEHLDAWVKMRGFLWGRFPFRYQKTEQNVKTINPKLLNEFFLIAKETFDNAPKGI